MDAQQNLNFMEELLWQIKYKMLIMILKIYMMVY